MRKLVLLICLVIAATVVLLAGPCKPEPNYQLPQLPERPNIDVTATRNTTNPQLVELSFSVSDPNGKVVTSAQAATTVDHWVEATQRFAGTEILRGRASVDDTGTVEYVVTIEKGSQVIAQKAGKTAISSKQGT